MKLLFLSPEYVLDAGGGIITFYRTLLPLLAAQGHEVRVIVGSGVASQSDPIRKVVDDVRVEYLDEALVSKYFDRFTRYSAMPGLRRHLAAAWGMWEQAGRGDGFDVVEASDWGLLYLPWVVEGGPPTVVQLHGSIGQIDRYDPVRGEEAAGTLIRMLEAVGARRARAAQAYSRANAQFWETQSGREVEHIFPAWQPMIEHQPSGSRSARGLVVGRVQRWKGPVVLCEALRLLGDRAPGIDWMGRDTSYESRSQTTSGYLGEAYSDVWGKLVLQKPQQPPEETARLQSGAGFAVVPSLWDTFNFTCTEFMGAGTPTVCSTGAGASELIQDGVNGFVFEKGDAESLAAALDRLFAMSEQQRRDLGEAGRQSVLRELDLERIAGFRIESFERAVRAGKQWVAPPEDWFREACAPANAGRETLDFLDHLPLKELMRYVLGRARKKLTR